MADKKRDASLEEQVRANSPRLLRSIRRKLSDRTEVEDVYQEVVEDFIHTYDLGVAIESVGAWLVTVAQNKILDRFRRKKTAADYRDLLQDTSLDVSEIDISSSELKEAILSALETLPEDQRDVFIRHELEGQSFEEIAAATGVKVNTLLSRKRYAVLSLRESLQEFYDETK